MSDEIKDRDWMEGFPPSEADIISLARGNYYNWPQLRWTFSNIQQLVPTKNIWRGPGAAQGLNLKDAGLGRLHIQGIDGSSLGWREALETTDTDGLAILKRGELVSETYLGYCGPHKAHLIMSCGKSFAGLLAEMLIDEGVLDEKALIPEYLPEMVNTAWKDATLRQVMDMLVGMEFNEDYLEASSDIWRYLRAGGMAPGSIPEGDPRHLAEYLMTVKKQGEHGTAFAYREPNINILTFVIQRVTAAPLQDLVSDRLWRHIGAEHDGTYMLDPAGMCTTPACTLRDFLRFGEFVRTGPFIDRLVAGGDPGLFALADFPEGIMRGWSYTSQWWIRHHDQGRAVLARGAHGQLLYIDPANELVIARYGSSRLPAGYLHDPIVMAMIDAIAVSLA